MATLDEQLREYSSKFMVNPPLAEGTSLPENVLIPVIFARSAEAYKGGQAGLEKRARVTFEDASGATYYLYHDPDKPGHFLALNQDEWNAQIWKGNDALGTDREPVRIPVRDVWYPPNRESWARGPEPAPSSSKDLGIVLRGDRWVYEDTGVEFPDVEAWVHPDENYYRSRVYEDGSIPQVSLGVVDFKGSQLVRFGVSAEKAPVAEEPKAALPAQSGDAPKP